METIAVDPSDLHTVIWCFYHSDDEHSQAEKRAADRLNVALAYIGWESCDPQEH